MRYWLVKSEPFKYSWETMLKDRVTYWDGVRNYQARNFMRDKMRIGDMVLYYHSNTKPPHIAGISQICKESYPDATQFDENPSIMTLRQRKRYLDGFWLIWNQWLNSMRWWLWINWRTIHYWKECLLSSEGRDYQSSLWKRHTSMKYARWHTFTYSIT